MTRKLGLLSATVLTVATAVSVPGSGAHAQPVSYFGEDPNPTGATPIPHPISDATQAAFFSQLQNIGTDTLDSYASGTTTVNSVFGNGITAQLTGGVIQNFSSGGRFAISSPNYYETDTSSFAIRFSAPIAAFGFYGTDIGDFGGVLSLLLTDTSGNVTQLTVPALEGSGGSQPENGSVLYFGFLDRSDTFTSIAFENSNTTDAFGFDNFSVGVLSQVMPVPEPSALVLLGSGMVCLGLLRRRPSGKALRYTKSL
jgi:hypothetical protein